MHDCMYEPATPGADWLSHAFICNSYPSLCVFTPSLVISNFEKQQLQPTPDTEDVACFLKKSRILPGSSQKHQSSPGEQILVDRR